MADPGGDDIGAERVRFLHPVAGDDPERRPLRFGGPPAGGFHHPGQPAADQRHAGLGQPPPDLLGQVPRLRASLTAAGTDDGHLTGAS
jgi:hypothetical protein